METKQTVTSPMYSINWKDVLRGLVVSVGTSVTLLIYDTLEKGNLNFNWKEIGLAGLAAAFAYLTKNFFTPPVVKTPIESKDINPETPTTAK